MLSVPSLRRHAFRLVQARVGKQTHQVVEPVTRTRSIELKETIKQKLSQTLLRKLALRLPDRRSTCDVKCVRKHRQGAELFLLVRRQQFVAQAQRRVNLCELQAFARVRQLPRVVSGTQVNSRRQGTSHRPQGEGKIPAKPSKIAGVIVPIFSQAGYDAKQ